MARCFGDEVLFTLPCRPAYAEVESSPPFSRPHWACRSVHDQWWDFRWWGSHSSEKSEAKGSGRGHQVVHYIADVHSFWRLAHNILSSFILAGSHFFTLSNFASFYPTIHLQTFDKTRFWSPAIGYSAALLCVWSSSSECVTACTSCLYTFRMQSMHTDYYRARFEGFAPRESWSWLRGCEESGSNSQSSLTIYDEETQTRDSELLVDSRGRWRSGSGIECLVPAFESSLGTASF